MKTNNRPFMDWLARWMEDLPEMALDEVVADPKRAAILMVDLTRGFCCEGPLASPRVAGIVPAVVQLARQAYDLGVRHFLLPQDAHDPQAIEFSAYPPHALADTTESETVDELQALPFSDLFVVMPKNTISCNLGTDLDPWLDDHPQVNTFIVTGDCTDICVYQAAMYLRMRANLLGRRDDRVLVPADCVQTYDLSVEAAQEAAQGAGVLPHDGDLLHAIFLYHMALNGVEAAARLV
jgi:nicotinamidase-related amidase